MDAGSSLAESRPSRSGRFAAYVRKLNFDIQKLTTDHHSNVEASSEGERVGDGEAFLLFFTNKKLGKAVQCTHRTSPSRRTDCAVSQSPIQNVRKTRPGNQRYRRLARRACQASASVGSMSVCV